MGMDVGVRNGIEMVKWDVGLKAGFVDRNRKEQAVWKAKEDKDVRAWNMGDKEGGTIAWSEGEDEDIT